MSVLISALLLVVGGGGARAAQEGRHCAVRLVPVSTTGHVTQARLEKIGCFDTFAESLHAGTGGNLRVATDTRPQDLTDRMIAESSADRRGLGVLIGTEFGGTGYSGGSNDYYAPDACTSGVYEVSYVGDWNDRFESGRGFGGCDHNKKFANSNFGGSVLTCTPSCQNYGALANEVSSLRWRP